MENGSEHEAPIKGKSDEGLFIKLLTWFSGKSCWQAIAAGVLSALLLTAGLPFLRWWPLAFIALVPLFICLRTAACGKIAAAGGAAFGFCLCLSSMYWIGKLAPVAIFGLAIAKGIVPALAAWAIFKLCRCFRPDRIGAGELIMLAAAGAGIWVFGEYLQTVGVIGITWGFLCLTLARCPILLQINSFFGMWGLSFCLAFTNFILAEFLLNKADRAAEKEPEAAKTAVLPEALKKAFIVLAVMWGLIVFYGGVILTANRELGDNGQMWGVVQLSIPQKEKFDQRYIRRNFNDLAKESARAVRMGAQVVAWPETSIPYPGFLQNEQAQNQVKRMINRRTAHYLIGSIEFADDGRSVNTMSSWDVKGELKGSYDKYNLVPFGEYLPARKLWPKWLPGVDEVMDFKAGESIHCLPVDDAQVGVLICFESLCTWVPRRHVLNGAEILYVPTNDAWFDDSIELPGHFDMGIMHAVSLRRPLVQAGNNGVSGFIDKTGRVLQESVIDKRCTLVEKVIPNREMTLYARLGDYFPFVCMAAAALIYWLRLKEVKAEV
ncbi:apolipoprotein N-acyltransferase [bacterium]|nr:apolipoprotein N-acyltransferase [bacterium]